MKYFETDSLNVPHGADCSWVNLALRSRALKRAILKFWEKFRAGACKGCF